MTTNGKIKCAICGNAIDPSACGQLLVRVNIEDDTTHATTGRTERKRLILCEEHSLDLSIWLNEQSIKSLQRSKIIMGAI
jgi:hypothetical protein